MIMPLSNRCPLGIHVIHAHVNVLQQHSLLHSIERSFKLRRPLMVTCLDYSKAFDSIKR